MSDRPEAWLRGPVAGVPASLQPVAHALTQVAEETRALLEGFPEHLLWRRPGGVASVGFHLRHIPGVVERLFTYADGRPLSAEQLEALRAESSPDGAEALPELLDRLDHQIAAALDRLRVIDPETFSETRHVGRQRLPSTVAGLLFHAAEHAQRHLGQLSVTARLLLAAGEVGGAGAAGAVEGGAGGHAGVAGDVEAGGAGAAGGAPPSGSGSPGPAREAVATASSPDVEGGAMVGRVESIDHVQIAIPAGEEERARSFYRDVLGLLEIEKPEPMRATGGVWFRSGSAEVHLGVDPEFRPSHRAHPGLRVIGLEGVRDRCEAAGIGMRDDSRYPGVRRFFVDDPFGNRIELLEPE